MIIKEEDFNNKNENMSIDNISDIVSNEQDHQINFD